MNPRQRILAAIERQPVDRIPTDIWATPEVEQKLKDYCGCRRLSQTWDCLGIDGIVDIKPDYVGPRLPDPGPDRQIDEWGLVRKWQPYDTGGYWELDVNPLSGAQTIADIDAFAWPKPEWYDYLRAARQGRRASAARHHVRLHRHLLLSQPAARAGTFADGPGSAPRVHGSPGPAHQRNLLRPAPGRLRGCRRRGGHRPGDRRLRQPARAAHQPRHVRRILPALGRSGASTWSSPTTSRSFTTTTAPSAI